MVFRVIHDLGIVASLHSHALRPRIGQGNTRLSKTFQSMLRTISLLAGFILTCGYTSADNVEVHESELIEMIGYVSAQDGGIYKLKLDEEAIGYLALGFEMYLRGDRTMDDIDPAEIDDAYARARRRMNALEGRAPEIDEETLQLIGLALASQSGLQKFGFDEEDTKAIKRGFIKGSTADEVDPAMETNRAAIEQFLKKRTEQALAAEKAEADQRAAKRRAHTKTFFVDLRKDPQVEVTRSGLHYKVLDPGTGRKPRMRDRALIHYKGTLIDGTQFDSSYDRGEPTVLPLKRVVKGFGEGLTKVGAGGKIILYIPSKLGYGSSPRPGGVIRPGDALIFECELIEINP